MSLLQKPKFFINYSLFNWKSKYSPSIMVSLMKTHKWYIYYVASSTKIQFFSSIVDFLMKFQFFHSLCLWQKSNYFASIMALVIKYSISFIHYVLWMKNQCFSSIVAFQSKSTNISSIKALRWKTTNIFNFAKTWWNLTKFWKVYNMSSTKVTSLGTQGVVYITFWIAMRHPFISPNFIYQSFLP